MIVRATAIPLACYPYSSTSHIVHWFTRHHGKISTLLKGAMRPKSPFLGEYELFSTSELLYFTKRTDTLYTAKECALLYRRKTFRTDWRAMQTASYLSALIARTTPEESPHPEGFEWYENQLDLAEEFGAAPQFVFWMELQFCNSHGQAPQLEQCVLCESKKALRFCGSQGGLVCAKCAKAHKLPTLEVSSDVLAVLQAWQAAHHPSAAVKTQLNAQQRTALNALIGSFMMHQFNIPSGFRNTLIQDQLIPSH